MGTFNHILTISLVVFSLYTVLYWYVCNKSIRPADYVINYMKEYTFLLIGREKKEENEGYENFDKGALYRGESTGIFEGLVTKVNLIHLTTRGEHRSTHWH